MYISKKLGKKGGNKGNYTFATNSIIDRDKSGNIFLRKGMVPKIARTGNRKHGMGRLTLIPNAIRTDIMIVTSNNPLDY